MDSVRQVVSRTALGVAEYLQPILRNSKFRETGVITPAEFVAAGDFLVHQCPTWQWACGDKSRTRPYLPSDRQYLLTRGVPCYRRVRDMAEQKHYSETLVEVDGLDGGWVDTHFGADPDEAILDIDSAIIGERVATSPVEVQPATANAASDDEEDDEPEDLDAFLQSGMLDQADEVVAPVGANATCTNSTALSAGTDSGILQTRTYDIYITYDKYYQTARLWLYGYNESHKPLSDCEMYEDFSQDHAKKTVTTEQHPHLPGSSMPSIHPCRQADVMRRLMEAMSEGGAELNVCQYLLVFLKFVQTVIPTIEYDYTRNFSISNA